MSPISIQTTLCEEDFEEDADSSSSGNCDDSMTMHVSDDQTTQSPHLFLVPLPAELYDLLLPHAFFMRLPLRAVSCSWRFHIDNSLTTLSIFDDDTSTRTLGSLLPRLYNLRPRDIGVGALTARMQRVLMRHLPSISTLCALSLTVEAALRSLDFLTAMRTLTSLELTSSKPLSSMCFHFRSPTRFLLFSHSMWSKR
jgi:hypothetical protein